MNPPLATQPRARPLWPAACTFTAAPAPLVAAAVNGSGMAHGHHHAGLTADGLAGDALSTLAAVVAFTSAVSWPALRVAPRPDRDRPTLRSALLATAGAGALALPLALVRPLSGVDAHLWGDGAVRAAGGAAAVGTRPGTRPRARRAARRGPSRGSAARFGDAADRQ